MRAVIIGNGSIDNYEYIKSYLNDDDYIICADGGLKHIEKLGVAPNVAIGDFDSSEYDENVKNYVYPKNKDFTDGELAVNYAVENGYSPILLVAMTGTRLDHTMTNIFQLAKNKNISLIDDHNEIYFIEDKLEFIGKKGKTLSIIPVYSDLRGITSTGLKYPLNNETLYFGEGRGNSNVVIDDLCTISVRSGKGVVIINDGE